MIVQALLNLRPGAEWKLLGTSYEDIEWLDSFQTLPSQEEINTEILRINQEYQELKYQRDRAVEYPPLSELADALYWQSKGNNQPMTNYIATCEAVKVKYPKEA